MSEKLSPQGLQEEMWLMLKAVKAKRAKPEEVNAAVRAAREITRVAKVQLDEARLNNRKIDLQWGTGKK